MWAGGASHGLVANTVVFRFKLSASCISCRIATHTFVAIDPGVQLVKKVGVVGSMVRGTSRLLGFGLARNTHIDERCK